jgi:hypothetical protein
VTPSDTAAGLWLPAWSNARTLTKYVVPSVRLSPEALAPGTFPTVVNGWTSVPPGVVPIAHR